MILSLIGLILEGYIDLLFLALPGILVFIWHLNLVSRRSERRQIGVEILGNGVLALSAPAAYWVGHQSPDSIGWMLFFLCWGQSSASILYAYLRLQQRELGTQPDLNRRLQMGKSALIHSLANLILVLVLSILGILPVLLPIPYGLQAGETIWGTLKPAIGLRPTQIGLRQLFISTLFTVLFIITWNS